MRRQLMLSLRSYIIELHTANLEPYSSAPLATITAENKRSDVAARVVKARLEKTTLGDIAQYIEEVRTVYRRLIPL